MGHCCVDTLACCQASPCLPRQPVPHCHREAERRRRVTSPFPRGVPPASRAAPRWRPPGIHVLGLAWERGLPPTATATGRVGQRQPRGRLPLPRALVAGRRRRRACGRAARGRCRSGGRASSHQARAGTAPRAAMRSASSRTLPVAVAARSAPCQNHTMWCFHDSLPRSSWKTSTTQNKSCSDSLVLAAAGANPELGTHTWNTSYSNVFQISSCEYATDSLCGNTCIWNRFGIRIPAYSPALVVDAD